MSKFLCGDNLTVQVFLWYFSVYLEDGQIVSISWIFFNNFTFYLYNHFEYIWCLLSSQQFWQKDCLFKVHCQISSLRVSELFKSTVVLDQINGLSSLYLPVFMLFFMWLFSSFYHRYKLHFAHNLREGIFMKPLKLMCAPQGQRLWCTDQQCRASSRRRDQH